METLVTPDFIKPYFKGAKKHKQYWKALDYYQHMAFHFNGYFLHIPNGNELINSGKGFAAQDHVETNAYFTRLIDMRRPSESAEIKSYRRDVYLPLTQSACFKVYNSLRKIVKSPDWSIDYTRSEKPSGIADGEYLEDYCEKEYPKYTSVENWFYNYGMKQMLIDSNALIYVLPKEVKIDTTEYPEPIANIINCIDVLEFKENDYTIFILDRHYEYSDKKIVKYGLKLGVITKQGYWEIKQNNTELGFEITLVISFEMEYLPAWTIGGVINKDKKEYTLYNSFMSPMLPGLDSMARESSDADAEIIQHIYTEKWYLTQQDCKHCMGKGFVNGKGKQTITCSECNGTGGMPKSPYRHMVIKVDNTTDVNKIPIPPAGEIPHTTDIAKLFMERLTRHQWVALSAINHEFLAEAPIQQSGIAKAYDRQELENFVYSVAYHSIENVLKPVYYFINEFRYKVLVPNETERERMLPKISVPIRYDIITAGVLEQQMKAAMDAKVDPEIIDEIEMEYAVKNFPNNIELRDRLKLKKTLDPFPRISVDEKNSLLLTKSVDMIDVIVSNYLHVYLERALNDYPQTDTTKKGFVEMTYEEQNKIIYGYAQEKMKSMSTAQQVLEEANNTSLKKQETMPK